MFGSARDARTAASALKLALFATLLQAAARPEPVHACSGPCSRLGASRPVEGGTTLLSCSECEEVPALEAVDASGNAHAGTVAELAGGMTDYQHRTRAYYVWRPAQPLPAGDYRLRALQSTRDDDGDLCDLTEFPAEIHVPESGGTAEPLPETTLTLGIAYRGVGTGFECADVCDNDSRVARSQLAPYLEPQIVLAAEHPARVRYLARLVAATPDGPIEGDWWPLGALTGPTQTEDGLLVASDMQRGGVVFPAAQDEYCAALELMDIVDGARETVDAGCVQHDLPPERLTTGPAGFRGCERFVDATMAQYVEAYCRENAAECAGSSDSRCRDWLENCSAPLEDSGRSDASRDARTEPDDDDDDAEGERSPPRQGSGGCRVQPDALASALWAQLLVVVWLVRRARRRFFIR